jgi:biopolymer transport protein ExbD
MRHRPNELICNINLTGFASVMLAVLYRFMYRQVDVHKSHHGLEPDLPGVSDPVSMAHADWEDAVVVAITRDDKVFLRRDRVRPDQLPAKIRKSIRLGSERKVSIRADGRRGIAGLPRFLKVCVLRELSKSGSWWNREKLLFPLRNNAETVGRSPCYNSISPERFTSRLML